MGRLLGIRSILAKGRDRGIDDARMLFRDRVIADAQAIDDAGAESLDHDIATGRQAQGGFHALGFFQVQLHTLFVAMRIGEKYRSAVALGTDNAVRLAAIDGF